MYLFENPNFIYVTVKCIVNIKISKENLFDKNVYFVFSLKINNLLKK